MRTLVLGLGNTLLKDDGVAVKIVDALKPVLVSHNLDVKTSSLSGLALLDEIIGYDRLIVVDAIQSHTHAVGEVFSVELTAFQNSACGTSPHYIGLPSLIHYCQRYGLGMPREIQILGIEVDDPFTIDEKLCDKLEQEFDVLVEKVKDRILH